MPASAQHAEARARRLSAALSLLLLVALAVGLHRWTAGFEVWTFEGRRMLQLQRGELAAQAVPLHTVGPAALWSSTNGAPGAYLVDFIYTRCPSVCRALGSEYQQMQRELAAQPARVRLVSMSFDVAHDTPQQLAAHAATHHADPRWWTLAVPTSDAGAQALLRSLGVVAVDDGQGGFVHNGDLHLLDAHGRLRGLYTLDDWPQALAAARALAAAGTPATPR